MRGAGLQHSVCVCERERERDRERERPSYLCERVIECQRKVPAWSSHVWHVFLRYMTNRSAHTSYSSTSTSLFALCWQHQKKDVCSDSKQPVPLTLSLTEINCTLSMSSRTTFFLCSVYLVFNLDNQSFVTYKVYIISITTTFSQLHELLLHSQQLSLPSLPPPPSLPLH